MLSRLAVLLVLCVGILADAAALSCANIENHYIFQCDSERCHAAFSVRDAHGSRACSRRPQVEAIDPRVVLRATQLVDAVRPPGAGGLYKLTRTKRYWAGDEDDPLVWFRDDTSSAVTLLQADASPEVLASQRAQYASAERWAYWKSILFSSAFWSSAVIALLAFIASVQMYFARLYSTQAPRKLSGLLVPVAIQLAVGCAGLVIALFGLTGLFWPGLILLPAVPVILVSEGWALFLKRRAEKQGRQQFGET
jgi:hypothetical protein